MKNQHKAAATAILGLAFGGAATGASAETGLEAAETSFAAVNNLAAGAQTSTPFVRAAQTTTGTVAASGTPIGQAATATGNSNTELTAQTILNACAGGANAGTAFQADCNALVGDAGSDPTGAEQAMAGLTGDQPLALNHAATRQVGIQTNVASSRMLGLVIASQQARDSRMNSALAAGLLYGRQGGGASADALNGETGAFFNAKYLDGSQDRDQYTYGYDLDSWNFTFGGDYRFGPNLIGGAMANYTQGSVDYNANKGQMTTDGWGLGAYGTYYLDNGLFFEGVTGYNWNSADLERRIDYTLDDGQGNLTQVRQTAKSNPDSGVFYATLGGGYSLNRQALSFTPQLSLNYVHNSVGSYRERMSDPQAPGGSWALAYDSQSFTSFTSRLGVMVANAFSTKVGVFVPQVSLDWIHEFKNNQEGLSARFINDLSANPLTVWTTKPDHNYFDLSLGISGQFANGRSVFLNYNAILGYEDVSQYAITGGVRFEF